MTLQNQKPCALNLKILNPAPHSEFLEKVLDWDDHRVAYRSPERNAASWFPEEAANPGNQKLLSCHVLGV